MILNGIKLHPNASMITVNNGELDSFYEIPDDWHEIASIDYNVMCVHIVNTIRIINCSGLRIYDSGSIVHKKAGLICYKHNINNIYS